MEVSAAVAGVGADSDDVAGRGGGRVELVRHRDAVSFHRKRVVPSAVPFSLRCLKCSDSDRMDGRTDRWMTRPKGPIPIKCSSAGQLPSLAHLVPFLFNNLFMVECRTEERKRGGEKGGDPKKNKGNYGAANCSILGANLMRFLAHTCWLAD